MGTGRIIWSYLLLTLVWLAFLGNANVTASKLPASSIPSHYSLDLILDPRATTFDGVVEIDFKSTNTSMNTIKLHASNETIKITQALLNYKVACEETEYDGDFEIVSLTCPSGSLKSENVLIIHYVGTFSTDDMDGLYKSTYVDGDEENVLLSTQFESVSARKAFPCFDEPSFKATFDIFITHPNDYSALANTPAVKQFSVAPSQTQTLFETTPLMSTYLIAFVVSKFVPSVPDPEHDNKDYDYQVFSRPNVKEFTDVATKFGPTLIDSLSNYTGIPYKDLGNTQAYQVAIPDFAAGAMENWGLITYREVDLLDEDNNTSRRALQRILTTVAHELTHQWFGDYVTLDWWSDTWLNEGFATYFEYFIPDQIGENLETMKQFVVSELQPVLQVDSLSSALPLTSDADTEAEISDKFDDISYSKGGSILRMLRNIIGESVFKEGLNTYLTKNSYKNSNPSILLNAFKTEPSLNLTEIMNNWIYKPGFPLVTVALNGSAVVLTQERFSLQNLTEEEETQWYVPISYTTGKEKNFNINISEWLEPDSTLKITLEDKKTWVVVNLQEAGYYRVIYDMTLLHRIIAALEDDKDNIDVLNRAQLIDDAFNAARGGRHSYEMTFHLAKYLVSETDYYPWVSALNALSFIRGKLDDEKAETLLQEKILYWLGKAFPPKKPNFGTEHVDILKAALIRDWTCKLGQKECIEYASDAFEEYKKSAILSDYNERSVIFCHGLANSQNQTEDFNFLFNVFKDSSSVVEQNEIINALGCVTDPELLKTYLLETISENSAIRKQDTLYVFRAVYGQGEAGVNVSLEFLEKNLTEIVEAYKGMNALPNLILGLAGKVISKDHIDRLKKIIEDNKDIEEVKLVESRAIEIMDANRLWTDTYAEEIKKVLEDSPNDANVLQPTILSVVLTLTIYLLFKN